jgi:hypothetical protein
MANSRHTVYTVQCHAGNSTILCAQNFYLSCNNGTHVYIECKLLCEAWINPGDSYTLFETVFTIMSGLFCLFTCVILAVIAFSVQKDEM